jgi:uncharacterized membrane protein YccC
LADDPMTWDSLSAPTPDGGMAALSGLALMVAVMFCCILWIFAGWPERAVAATMAAVFSSTLRHRGELAVHHERTRASWPEWRGGS